MAGTPARAWEPAEPSQHVRSWRDPWTYDLANIDDLVAAGHLAQTARRRIHRGTWQEPVPGVVARFTGALTPRQWLTAALLYGGPDAQLSHQTAAELLRIWEPSMPVHITVGAGHNLRSTAEVRVHQSQRPRAADEVDGFPVTAPARTVIDLCARLRSDDAARNVMGRAIQQGLTRVDDLAAELELAPKRGSLRPKRVLDEARHNVHSASEARFLLLIRNAGIREPEMNAAVETIAGTKYVDALWRELGKGAEIDGRRYHLSPDSWQRDLARQNAIHSAGVTLLRIAAQRIWTDQHGVVDDVRAFLAA